MIELIYLLDGQSIRKMALKDEIKQENIKIKDMPLKKKAKYIWDYYKFPILGVLVGLFLLGTFIRDYRINSRPIYLDAILINSDLAYSPEDGLKEDFIRYASVDTDTYNLMIDSSIIIDKENYDQMSVANAQKVLAMYTAGDMDVIIGPESIIDEYGAMGAHMDLEGIMSDELKKDLETKGFSLYYTTEYEEDENGETTPIGTYPAGIYLENSDYLKGLGERGAYATLTESGQKPVFTITATSKRSDNALQLLKMIAGL